MTPSIVTVTLNPCIDKFFAVSRVVPDRKLAAHDARQDPGGGGINVARAVAKLGGQALALWSCGGLMGQLLAELLDHEGIVHQQVAVAEATRENIIVYDESIDDQFRFGMPGPRLGAGELDRWKDRITRLDPAPAYLVLSGSLPPGASAGWFAGLVRDAPEGARVVVDTKGDALRQAIEAGVYLIKPNVHELEEIVEQELDSDEKVEDAARAIVSSQGASVVLISMGRAGAVLASADGIEHIRAPVVRYRSKVGAGDSTVAGIVHALVQDFSLVQAARYGVAAGAAAVMTEGTELCRREDVERLYECMQREQTHARDSAP
jgi:6-phosphofructokinase 2